MTPETFPQCTAFTGSQRIASGDLATVVHASHHAASNALPVLIFDDTTGRVIDVDFRGTPHEAVARLGTPRTVPPAPPETETGRQAPDSPYREDAHARGRGRPRLGVIAREVTLLPRHWDWLATQPGGASAAVRRLVDEARQTHAAKDRRRQAQEAAYRFMSAMAGNEPGFEEATRALFAGDEPRFAELTAGWPGDVRDHARMLAARAFT